MNISFINIYFFHFNMKRIQSHYMTNVKKIKKIEETIKYKTSDKVLSFFEF